MTIPSSDIPQARHTAFGFVGIAAITAAAALAVRHYAVPMMASKACAAPVNPTASAPAKQGASAPVVPGKVAPVAVPTVTATNYITVTNVVRETLTNSVTVTNVADLNLMGAMQAGFSGLSNQLCDAQGMIQDNGQKLDTANAGIAANSEALSNVLAQIDEVRLSTDSRYAGQVRSTATLRADTDTLSTNVPSQLVREEAMYYFDKKREKKDPTIFVAELAKRYGFGAMPAQQLTPSVDNNVFVNLMSMYRADPRPELSMSARGNTRNLERHGAEIWKQLSKNAKVLKTEYPGPDRFHAAGLGVTWK